MSTTSDWNHFSWRLRKSWFLNFLDCWLDPGCSRFCSYPSFWHIQMFTNYQRCCWFSGPYPTCSSNVMSGSSCAIVNDPRMPRVWSTHRACWAHSFLHSDWRPKLQNPDWFLYRRHSDLTPGKTTSYTYCWTVFAQWNPHSSDTSCLSRNSGPADFSIAVATSSSEVWCFDLCLAIQTTIVSFDYCWSSGLFVIFPKPYHFNWEILMVPTTWIFATYSKTPAGSFPS